MPGASLAVLDRDEIHLAAAGVINLETGVETTTDTLFQIGSITKIYNATLVMQLVDAGLVELDAPVKTYLPNLRFADRRASDVVTLRQLLTHTGGLDGDFFEDTGRGDDSIERYVDACANLPQIAEPGVLFSYCNAGFTVTGRLIEVLTGLTWDEALKKRLFDPLRVTKSMTLPEDAILHRTAVGHIVDADDPDGDLVRTPFWHFSRGTGPAGNIVATANDLLTFVRMHLDEGVSLDGTKILSAESVRAMQERQFELPEGISAASAWGLGWMIFDWSGTRLIGHDGGTPGQSAFLRIVPEERFAVALLTNGATGLGLYRDLYTEILAKRNIAVPEPPVADDTVELDPSRFVGKFERYGVVIDIERDGETGLVATVEVADPELATLVPERRELRLRPVDANTFLFRFPGSETDTIVLFFDDDEDGRPTYLHSGGRAARRTS